MMTHFVYHKVTPTCLIKVLLLTDIGDQLSFKTELYTTKERVNDTVSISYCIDSDDVACDKIMNSSLIN